MRWVLGAVLGAALALGRKAMPTAAFKRDHAAARAMAGVLTCFTAQPQYIALGVEQARALRAVSSDVAWHATPELPPLPERLATAREEVRGGSSAGDSGVDKNRYHQTF